MEENYVTVETDGSLKLQVQLNHNDTFGYVKTIACSEWGIEYPSQYLLLYKEELFHDECVIPPGQIYVLRPRKGEEHLQYNSILIANQVSNDESKISESYDNSKKRELYDNLQSHLLPNKLCPFSEIKIIGNTLLLTLTGDNTTMDKLNNFSPKPLQINYYLPNQYTLYFKYLK